eukprot:3144258-Heterocapsa_arctica.AAC.1
MTVHLVRSALGPLTMGLLHRLGPAVPASLPATYLPAPPNPLPNHSPTSALNCGTAVFVFARATQGEGRQLPTGGLARITHAAGGRGM